MKFHQNILNGYQVVERTRFRDGQTDGRTDRRAWENNMSPDPEAGRHNYTTEKICRL